jgi:RsiW-degrading membrane proteinase PrsW (M82 family)
MTNVFGKTLLVSGIELIFYVLTILFCIHAAVLAYHWFSYGDNKQTAWTALATYLIGGAVLLFSIAGALYFV